MPPLSPFVTNGLDDQSFAFRTRRVSATGTQVVKRPHVLLLQVHPSAIATLADTIIRLLPTRVRSWVVDLFPEWFLPDRVVLKMRKRDVEDARAKELFDTEIEAYRRLRPLQGLVVPRCFGEVRYNGDRALIFEDVGGHALGSPEGSLLSIEELAPMLLECYRALNAFGVHQDDFQPTNFHLVQGRLVALDLEMAELDPPTESLEFYIGTSVEELLVRYSRIRKCLRSDRLLEAA